jgi:hypothetical protein
MLRWVLLCGLAVNSAATTGAAADWARKMFTETSHDFATIARGAKAEYRFVLKNIYLGDIHIADVRVSCGCTTPRIEKEWLKTYEEGAIVASINSEKFLGSQSSTITVTLDKPRRAEVQLHVTVYVHSEVVFQPASAQLGNVDRGTPVEKKISVSHTRRGDWRILEVKSGNPHLSGEVVETARQRNRVSYELRVRLDANAPAGYVRDYLMLVTNDGRSTTIPVLVEGCVLPGLSVSPASLFLGTLRPGQGVTKQVVVRGKAPFRIVSITADCNCFKIASPADAAAKPFHLVPITFTAEGKPGKIVKTIRIETDLDGAAAEVSAYAVVTPE